MRLTHLLDNPHLLKPYGVTPTALIRFVNLLETRGPNEARARYGQVWDMWQASGATVAGKRVKRTRKPVTVMPDMEPGTLEQDGVMYPIGAYEPVWAVRRALLELGKLEQDGDAGDGDTGDTVSPYGHEHDYLLTLPDTQHAPEPRYFGPQSTAWHGPRQVTVLHAVTGKPVTLEYAGNGPRYQTIKTGKRKQRRALVSPGRDPRDVDTVHGITTGRIQRTPSRATLITMPEKNHAGASDANAARRVAQKMKRPTQRVAAEPPSSEGRKRVRVNR